MSATGMTRNDLDAVGTTMTMKKGDEDVGSGKRNLTKTARSVESGGGKRRRKRKGKNVDESERRGRGSVTEVETGLKMKAKDNDIGRDVKDPFLGNLIDLNGPTDLTGLLRGM